MNHAKVATMSGGRNHKKHNARDLLGERNYSTLYLTNLSKMLDAHNTRVASIQFWKNALQAAVRSNYKNEYDRIRGLLAHTIMEGKSSEHLENRKQQLEKLGALATK